MRHAVSLVLVLALFWVSGCVPQIPRRSSVDRGTDSIEVLDCIPDRALAEHVFVRLNDERIQAKNLPMMWDERLYILAVLRGTDMWRRGYIGHHDPNTGALLVPYGVADEVLTASDDLLSDFAQNLRNSEMHWEAIARARTAAFGVVVCGESKVLYVTSADTGVDSARNRLRARVIVVGLLR